MFTFIFIFVFHFYFPKPLWGPAWGVWGSVWGLWVASLLWKSPSVVKHDVFSVARSQVRASFGQFWTGLDSKDRAVSQIRSTGVAGQLIESLSS